MEKAYLKDGLFDNLLGPNTPLKNLLTLKTSIWKKGANHSIEAVKRTPPVKKVDLWMVLEASSMFRNL